MESLDLRNQALTNVQKALPVFNDINGLCIQAQTINQQISAERARSAGNKNGTRLTAFFFACAAFCVLNIAASLISKFFGLFGLHPDGFLMMLVLVGAVFVYLAVKRIQDDKAANALQATEAQFNAQLQRISQDICQIYKDNAALIDLIPRDYRTYDAVTFFESALANGRADSMKEAIELYEEYVHRMILEHNSQIAVEQSRQQSAMLAEIERNSRSAAVSSGITATASVLNLLSRM